MERIERYSDFMKLGYSNIIYFDLDNTLITTIFTNNIPHKEMIFYKKGYQENRYSILRPGSYEVLASLSKKGYLIGILTDAKGKRAKKILEQFRLEQFISILLPQEILIDMENIFNIPRKEKPLNLFNGLYLFDDNIMAYERNRKQCALVVPFLCKLDTLGRLFIHKYGDEWMEWNEENCLKERNYILSLEKNLGENL